MWCDVVRCGYTMSYVESLRTFVARNYIGPEQQYVVRMGTLSTD